MEEIKMETINKGSYTKTNKKQKVETPECPIVQSTKKTVGKRDEESSAMSEKHDIREEQNETMQTEFGGSLRSKTEITDIMNKLELLLNLWEEYLKKTLVDINRDAINKHRRVALEFLVSYGIDFK